MKRAAIIAGVASVVWAGAGVATATHDSALGQFLDESSRIPFIPGSETIATDVEMMDFDLDGDLDLFVAKGDLAGGARAAQFFLNDGSGNFAARSLLKFQADFTDLEFGHANGDVRPDMVLSVNLGVERLLTGTLRTPKTGTTSVAGFSDRTPVAMPPGQPADVTIESRFFDADGDGDQDIIVANEDPFVGPGAQNRLYFNNGSGVFTDMTGNLPVILDDSSAFAIADFDAEASLDVITVNDGRFVYLDNDGLGRFNDETAAHLPPQPSTMNSGRDAVVGDFDRDGDLDVMFAISRADLGPVLWLNNGAGVFTDVSTTNVPLESRAAQDLEACDIDGDGDLDVVEANTGPILQPPTSHRFLGAQNRLLVNDGSGVFTDVTALHLPAVVDSSFSVACGDVTGDGRDDLVVANGKGEPMKLYVQQPVLP